MNFPLSSDQTGFNFKITGPLSPYKYTYTISYPDQKTMMFIITFTSLLEGNENEIFKIVFDKTYYLSTSNVELYNSEVECFLYKVPIVPEVIAAIGTSINTAMSVTMVALITSNVLLGQSSELLWGFLNTIQIMFYFPLLSLYYPDNLAELLTYFSSAKMQLPIPQIEQFKNNIKEKYSLDEKLKMPALNYRYESIGYESTSIILNSDDMFGIIGQGIFACVIVYGIRAFLFTLSDDLAYEEEDLKKFEENQQKKIDELTNKDNKGNRLKLWMKKKIIDMSKEYRFNFFLRLAIQLFLEASIVSILNIRYMKMDNFYQVVSLLISMVVLGLCVLFFLWSSYFSCKNYKKYRTFERINIQEVQSMFGQYKTKTLPQAMFNTYFMLRRMLYAAIIVLLVDYPIFQVFSYMVVFCPVLAYHVTMHPYLSFVENILMDINEATFLVIGVFFFIFAEPTTNQGRLNTLGWTVIGIIIALICLNFLVLWILKAIDIIKDLVAFYRKMGKKRENGISRLNTSHRNLNQNRPSGPLFNNITDETMGGNTRNLFIKVSQNVQLPPSQFLRVNMQENNRVNPPE